MSILASSIQARNVQTNIGRLQSEIDLLTGQIGTGKKTDKFSGLGIDSRRSLELRAQNNTYERYQTTISRTNLYLQFQVDALNQMDALINDALDDITAQQSGSTPDVTLLNQTTGAQLGELISLMNTQYDGRYVFGGRGTTDANVIPGQTRPPVLDYINDTAVPDLLVFGVTNYFTLLTDPAIGVQNIGTDGGGGATPAGATRIFQRLDYIFDQSAAHTAALTGLDAAVANSATPNDYASWYNGDIGDVPAGTVAQIHLDAEISKNLNVNYNSVIVDPAHVDAGGNRVTSGFEDVMKAMSLFATFQPSGGAIDPSNETEITNVIIQGMALLKQGQTKLQSEVSRLGETQSLLDRQEERNTEVLTFTQTSISEVEDIDTAKASTQLFQRQAQLEASYSVIGELRQLRLSNFI